MQVGLRKEYPETVLGVMRPGYPLSETGPPPSRGGWAGASMVREAFTGMCKKG